MAWGLIAVLAGWVGCFWLCRELAARQRIHSDWRLSLAFATCCWGAILTVIVEFLSLVHWFTKPGLLTAWLMVDLALWLAAYRLSRRHVGQASRLPSERPSASHSSGPSAGAGEARALPWSLWRSVQRVRAALDRLPAFAKWCWAGTVLLGAFLLGIAATTPPTNWDSMSYHLPRALHWIQQQSVDHFPTENTRQIEFGPWAAFVVAHLFLLEGTDRLVNLPQWLAMALTVLLLSLLVELLAKCTGPPGENDSGNPFIHSTPEPAHARSAGGSSATVSAWDSRGQSCPRSALRQRAVALTALIAVTVPMGMMQALTPQTDYVTALWLVCLFVFAFALLLEPANPLYVLGASLACGLGALTKATIYVYAAPLVLFGAVWLLRRSPGLAMKVKLGGSFCAVFFLLNAPHLLRNYALFGSPLGSSEIHAMECNARITPGTFASNLVRNLALHNNCGLDILTRGLNVAALTVHARTGEKLDDPGTTYPPGPVKFHERFLVYDDYASAPWHGLWIAVALAAGLWHPKRNARLLGYAGLVLGSFFLFVALLKFQVWHSRFHLAYLLLFSPFVALTLLRTSARWVCVVLVGSLYAYALFCLRHNEARPIFHPRFASLPRENQYLDIQASQWNAPLRRIAEEVVASGCQSVGLKLGFDAFEYPIWMKLRNRGFQGRIDHYYVDHVSARLASTAPPPCAIIARLSEPPAAVTNAYPYCTVYPPLMVLWASKPPERPAETVVALR